MNNSRIEPSCCFLICFWSVSGFANFTSQWGQFNLIPSWTDILWNLSFWFVVYDMSHLSHGKFLGFIRFASDIARLLSRNKSRFCSEIHGPGLVQRVLQRVLNEDKFVRLTLPVRLLSCAPDDDQLVSTLWKIPFHKCRRQMIGYSCRSLYGLK